MISDDVIAELASKLIYLGEDLTIRRCSEWHIQIKEEGVLFADWWPSSGKIRAMTSRGVQDNKCFSVDSLMIWLKAL